MTWVCRGCVETFGDIAPAGVHARETKHVVLRAEVAASVAAMPAKGRK